MRICRFNNGRIGLVKDDLVYDVSAVLDELPRERYPFPRHDVFIERLDELKPALEAAARSAKPLRCDEVSFAAPVANPGKVIAAPVNYLKHLEEARSQAELHHNNQIAEIQRVGLFLKANSSVIGASEGVRIAFPDRRNDHEIELVAVIGKSGRNIPARNALEYVSAYTIGLDMTVRGPEERSLRKSIDTYTVVGPWIVTSDELSDPSALDLLLTVNGEARQKANTRDLVIAVPELIEFASRFYTLHPGDLLFTGTPEGVGPVVPGDIIVAEISKIGALKVAVS